MLKYLKVVVERVGGSRSVKSGPRPRAGTNNKRPPGKEVNLLRCRALVVCVEEVKCHSSALDGSGGTFETFPSKRTGCGVAKLCEELDDDLLVYGEDSQHPSLDNDIGRYYAVKTLVFVRDSTTKVHQPKDG